MSLIKSEDKGKWINFFVAVVSAISAYVTIAFLGQLAEWFDLEARIRYFAAGSQGVGILVGLGVFLGLVKNKKTSAHMQEVYDELVKVVWPTKDVVIKVTIAIIIGVSVLSMVFVSMDYLFNLLLDLVY